VRVFDAHLWAMHPAAWPPRAVRLPSSMNAPLKLPVTAALLSLGLFGSCQVPRANLANLHEAHTPSGQISYHGDIRNDLEYYLARAFKGLLETGIAGSIQFGSDDGQSAGPSLIEDPLLECMENLLDLAGMDSSDPVTAGIQIEAFGWLAIDDHYHLGRERAVIELGRHARRLGIAGISERPLEPATASDLSPLLAKLAKASLGSLPDSLAPLSDADSLGTPGTMTSADGEMNASISALKELALDRNGGLRVLAVCNVLLERDQDNAASADAILLLQREMQILVVGQALATSMGDSSPLVRVASFNALANLEQGAPEGLLEVFVTDPEPTVMSAGLKWISANGLPPRADQSPASIQEEWIAFLVALCAGSDGLVTSNACLALGSISEAGFNSMRPEDWTSWWRVENPGQPMPKVLVQDGVGTGQ
jgi:hypothetical protein